MRCSLLTGRFRRSWRRLDYLFLDASFFRMHPGSPAEPVLAAWGITTGGKPQPPWDWPGPSVPQPPDDQIPGLETRPEQLLVELSDGCLWYLWDERPVLWHLPAGNLAVQVTR
jgi:hypothetical protein